MIKTRGQIFSPIRFGGIFSNTLCGNL